MNGVPGGCGGISGKSAATPGGRMAVCQSVANRIVGDRGNACCSSVGAIGRCLHKHPEPLRVVTTGTGELVAVTESSVRHFQQDKG